MRRITLRYPEDIIILCEMIPELKLVDPLEVQCLYEEFSETVSAGWLRVSREDEYWMMRFKEWLFKDKES